MITLCWAAKGGSGTTVVTASMAIGADDPMLLVDLGGDLPAVLGLPDAEVPGVHDWLRTETSFDRLVHLETAVAGDCTLVHAGGERPATSPRWAELADGLALESRHVLIDAGSGPPPPALVAVAERRWLVTRPCYLAVRAAVSQAVTPTGIILIDEPGRALGRRDVEASIGAPVVAELLVDPAIARAVDAGLLVARLPGAARRILRAVA